MLCRFCSAVVVIVVALAVSSTAGPAVDSCTLQDNTAVGLFKLSTLDSLFGELLTTESFGNIYFVSICRPIPQSFYDPRKLAGAIKLTQDGQTINLGRIDQTNVIVNENTIVLTYVGGDRDGNSKDSCKGLRWKTYVIFTCDVSATKDELILVDEDPDQPDICQVWFEVKTSKTCNRPPNVPVDVLEKELSSHYKQVYGEKDTEKIKTYFNGSSLSNNENSKLNIYQNVSKPIATENSSQNSSEDKPIVYTIPYPIIENKIINNEKKDNDFYKRTSEEKFYSKEKSSESSENKLFLNKNPNHRNNETEENDFHQIHSHKNNSEDIPIIKKNSNHTNSEKEENDFHKITPEEKFYSKEKSSESSENKPFINKNINHRNNETEENDFHKRTSEEKFYSKEKSSESSENKPFLNKNPNHRNNETEENDFHQIHSHKNNSEGISIIKKNSDHTNSEKEDNDFHKRTSEENLYDKEKSSESFENKPSINQNPNHKNNETEENDFHKRTSEEKFYNKEKSSESSENKPIINQIPNYRNNETEENDFHQIHSHKNNSEDIPIIKKNSDHTNSEKEDNDFHKRTSEENLYDKEKSSESFENKPSINQNPNHKNNENEENSSNQITPVEKATNFKNNEDRIKNKFIEDENSHSTYSENKLPNNRNDKLNNNFKHENDELKNGSSSTNVSNADNINDINYSDKNIPYYKNKVYIIHQNKNSKDLPINDSNEVNKSTNNENLHKDIFESTLHNEKKHGSIQNNVENEENSSSQPTSENQSSNIVADNFGKNKEHVDYGNYDKRNNSIYSKNYSYSENNKSDGHIIEDFNKKNSMINLHHKPIIDHNSIKNVDSIKHGNNGSSFMTSNNYKNQSGEVENVPYKKHFYGLHNYNKTNDESKLNSTFINQKYTENAHTYQSELDHREYPINSSSNEHLSNNNNGDKLKATNNVGFLGEIFNFKDWFSKLFPNGIHLSTATILGGLGSLTAVFGLIGTAVNRFYYKKTGTDQIPFKGSFLCIYSYVKGFITKIFSCCGRNLEEPDDVNEKTPLLHPKNIVTPKVEDETLRKNRKHSKSSDDDGKQKSKNSGNDKSSEQNNESQYGNLLNKRISPTSDKKDRKKKRKSKKSNTSSSDSGPENESWLYQDKEKLIQVKPNLQEKLPKEEVVNKKQSSTLDKPIESIFEKMGSKFKRTGSEKKEENVEPTYNVTSSEPQYVKSNIQSDVTSSYDSSETASPNKKDEIINVSETKEENNDDESVEVIEEIIYVEDGEDEGEIIEEIIETTTVEELPDETDFEKSRSLTDSGARKRSTTVTVRKISSSSSPGEVKTVEETVVSDSTPKNAKKGFGIKLGIGKSGVNMSLGEKKLGIGRSVMKFGKRKEPETKDKQEAMTIKLDKSGFKLHRNKSKSLVSTVDEEISELDKRNLTSSEKNKKSKSKSPFKLFKRSSSQPSVANISEIEDNPFPDDTVKPEVPSTSAGLLIFGKSRSRYRDDIMKRTL